MSRRLSPETIQKIIALCEAHPDRAAELFACDEDMTSRMIENLHEDANADRSQFIYIFEREMSDAAQDFIERSEAISADIRALQLVEA